MYPAIDSNPLTYLLEALEEGYDPTVDQSGLADERVAMVRCWFYGDCSFWVTPTVQQETAKIPNENWRYTHDRATKNLLQDKELSTPPAVIQRRVDRLRAHHSGENDCRIVAETEFAGLKTLLSCDPGLRKNLKAVTHVQLLKPTEFWVSLAIGARAQPVLQPLPGHPLFGKAWWLID